MCGFSGATSPRFAHSSWWVIRGQRFAGPPSEFDGGMDHEECQVFGMRGHMKLTQISARILSALGGACCIVLDVSSPAKDRATEIRDTCKID